MKAALFDLDGTLFDSLGIWKDIDTRFFAERGIVIPADYVDCINGMSFRQTAEYTRERFSLSETTDRIVEIWHDMCDRQYTDYVPLKPGAKEYLEKIKTSGALTAVVTTLSERLYTPALKRNGIFELFDAFCTTDESGITKKSGQVYLLAASRLGVKSEDCTVFEDIPEGLMGARAAGMKAILVKDPHNKRFEAQSLSLCDGVINDYREAILWI